MTSGPSRPSEIDEVNFRYWQEVQTSEPEVQTSGPCEGSSDNAWRWSYIPAPDV